MNNTQAQYYGTETLYKESSFEDLKNKYIEEMTLNAKREVEKLYDINVVRRRLVELSKEPRDKYGNLTTKDTSFVDTYIRCCRLFDNGYIPWHKNKLFPDITVDKLIEVGLDEFYEIVKNSSNNNNELSGCSSIQEIEEGEDLDEHKKYPVAEEYKKVNMSISDQIKSLKVSDEPDVIDDMSSLF